MKIGFIGLGKLGHEVSEVIAEKHDVLGYDINHSIQPEGVKVVNTIEEVVKDRDIVFIAVPTPHDPRYDGRYPCMDLEPKDFNYDIVKSVLVEVDRYATKKQLVALISTVLPGTINREFIPLIHNFRFIYNPYLIAMGTVKWDMVHPEMIILGTEDGDWTGDAKIMKEFYDTIEDPSTRFELGTWTEAEAIKIFYNTFISTKVAFVNMIQDAAERIGNMNVDVVTGALERSTYRIHGKAYMTAGMGDGGGCHPRDNIALRWMAKHYGFGYDYFQGIMQAREEQARNMADYLWTLSKHKRLPVVILGKAYKPDVDYLEGSYSILVGTFLEKNGITVSYDPQELKRAIYLLGHRGKFHEYKFPEGSVIVDPWRAYPKKDGLEVIHYGNTRTQS